MLRREDWPECLIGEIERHRTIPFAWGVADCVLFPADCVLAMTGNDPAAAIRGSYTDREGAYARLGERDLWSVGAAFASLFAEIPVVLAQRGDLGVIEIGNGPAMGVVFIDGGAIGKAEDRPLRRVPRSVVTRAFKV